MLDGSLIRLTPMTGVCTLSVHSHKLYEDVRRKRRNSMLEAQMAVKLTQCSEPYCRRLFEYETFCRVFNPTGERGLLACPYCGTTTQCNPDLIYFSRPLSAPERFQ